MNPDPDDVPAVLAAIDAMCHDTIPIVAAKLSPDVDGMVVLLQALRRAQAQMRWAEEELEDEIVKVMPRKDMVIDGVGAATLRTATARKQWDKDGLVAVLVARIADDPEILVEVDTGEMLTPHEQAERIIGLFLEAATPSWKTTGLRRFKIDPDEWCETTYGRKTVQTPKPDPWPEQEETSE